MLEAMGLLLGLALLIYTTMRGMNLFIATPLCALVVALSGGIALLPTLAPVPGRDLISLYGSGFADFVASWLFVFLLGALFGKLMEDSGAADSVSQFVTQKLGVKHAALAVVIACALLTYGGVSLFVVAFSVYPMAVSLFRQANLPRRFIPATLAFGSVTFTMTAAGSPEIQNWIPIPHLGTTPYAAWQASLVVAIFMALTGMIWLNWMIRRAIQRGEHFEARSDDPESSQRALPPPLRAAIPLLVVVGVSFFLHDQFKTGALIVALLAGCCSCALISWRYLQRPLQALSEGATGAIMALGNTAAVVGFGVVAKASPAFDQAINVLTHLPGGGLAQAAIGVTLIAAMTGSASGGQALALPILGPLFLGQGVNAEQLHRTVVIASGGLDSLPHNGYVVTTIRVICRDTHAAAYPAIGALTVIIPALGLALCLLLFALGM